MKMLFYSFLPNANNVWGKVMFSKASVTLSRGSASRGSSSCRSASRGGWADPPPHQTLQNMVNEWAVRILLECIIVNINNKKAFRLNTNLLAVNSTKCACLNMLRGWEGPCMVRGQNQGSWAWDGEGGPT